MIRGDQMCNFLLQFFRRIIKIDSGAQYPIVRFKQFDIRNFGLWLFVAQLMPVIINKALPFSIDRFNHLLKQIVTTRILKIKPIFGVIVGIRMRDEHTIHAQCK